MWWWAAPYYVARIGEARPIFIVMAAMVAIGILVWENPRHWTLWIAEVGVGAIVLIFLSDRRDRSLSSAIVAVAQEGLLRRPVSVAIGPQLLFGPSIAEYRSLPALSRGLTLRRELMTTRL